MRRHILEGSAAAVPIQPWGGRGATRLARPRRAVQQQQILKSVAVGIARYLSVDVTVVRIVFAVLAIMGGAGIPLYLAGWLLIPEEGAEQSIASDLIQSLSSRSR